eukprot:11128230-Heterocapsa_arctica.AAC.1
MASPTASGARPWIVSHVLNVSDSQVSSTLAAPRMKSSGIHQQHVGMKHARSRPARDCCSIS